MLAIRMQRLGRKGHPTYRVVVQDSRQTPTSGKVVAMLGSYDPHTKTSSLVKEKAQFYLDHGAQPSGRVVKLLTSEGIKLPKWAKEATKQTREIKNADKLRRNRPAEPETTPAEETSAADAIEETSTDNVPPEASAEPTTNPETESKPASDGEDEDKEPDESPAPGSDEFPEDKAVSEATEPTEEKEESKEKA